MSRIITLLFLANILISKNSWSQMINEIAHQSIEEAVNTLPPLLSKSIPSNTKIIGVGDVSSMAKESVKFNTSLMAYLIRKKGVRHVYILQSDWKLRPLNDYLLNRESLDSNYLKSLIRDVIGLGNYMSREFITFLEWLKKNNLSSSEGKVSISGIGITDPIPASYFLKYYIYQLDEASGKRIAASWAANDYSDSLSFKDVLKWYDEYSNKSRIERNNLALKIRLDEDITYNLTADKMWKLASPIDQLNAENIFQIIQLSKRLEKRAVFYAGNLHIAKAFIQSEEGEVRSIGMRLNDTLKEKYFVCLTGYSGTANLNLLDLDELRFRDIRLATKVKVPFDGKKSDWIIESENYDKLLNIIPEYIPAIIGDNRRIVLAKGVSAQNALFMLKDLTPISSGNDVLQIQ